VKPRVPGVRPPVPPAGPRAQGAERLETTDLADVAQQGRPVGRQVSAPRPVAPVGQWRLVVAHRAGRVAEQAVALAATRPSWTCSTEAT